VIIHRKKLFYREKKSIALQYIHPRTLYVGFTVKVDFIRVIRVTVGVKN